MDDITLTKIMRSERFSLYDKIVIYHLYSGSHMVPAACLAVMGEIDQFEGLSSPANAIINQCRYLYQAAKTKPIKDRISQAAASLLNFKKLSQGRLLRLLSEGIMEEQVKNELRSRKFNPDKLSPRSIKGTEVWSFIIDELAQHTYIREAYPAGPLRTPGLTEAILASKNFDIRYKLMCAEKHSDFIKIAAAEEIMTPETILTLFISSRATSLKVEKAELLEVCFSKLPDLGMMFEYGMQLGSEDFWSVFERHGGFERLSMRKMQKIIRKGSGKALHIYLHKYANEGSPNFLTALIPFLKFHDELHFWFQVMPFFADFKLKKETSACAETD